VSPAVLDALACHETQVRLTLDCMSCSITPSSLEAFMTVLDRVIEADRLLFAATLVMAVCGAACAAQDATLPSSPRISKAAGNAVYTASRKKTGGAEAQVNLLARAFLPPSSEAHPGFAYYAYLLFTDSTPNSAPARRAASASYLGMLAHVYAASEKLGIKREDMAVLYVPMADKVAADSLMADRDPQGLLAAYNYVRARGIAGRLKRAGKTIPDVAIIGSTRPLAANGVIDSDAIDVVDLSDPGTVAERMERFRDSLEAGERHLSEGGQPIVLKRLHEFFAWAETAGHDGSSVMTF
jgi:hypothetical protein